MYHIQKVLLLRMYALQDITIGDLHYNKLIDKTNSTVQDSTGVSPAQLVYRQDLWLPVDMLLGHVGRVPAADTFALE